MNLSDADVQAIIRLLDDSAYDELELETESLRLVLRRGGDGQPGWSLQRETLARPHRADASGGSDAPAVTTPPDGSTGTNHRAQTAARLAADVAHWADDGMTAIRSPIVGTFYRAPRPGADPFVKPGSPVGPDTVVAIIEVMKLMNSVAAGMEGEVVEIVVEDGHLVQKGQCLMRVRPPQDLAGGQAG